MQNFLQKGNKLLAKRSRPSPSGCCRCSGEDVEHGGEQGRPGGQVGGGGWWTWTWSGLITRF